jgi:hypothetical protein
MMQNALVSPSLFMDAEKIILLKGTFTDEIYPVLKEKYKDR